MRIHLDRIAEVNPQVNAIVGLDPEAALAAARDFDTAGRRKDGLLLSGLPVAVKDLIPAAGFRHTQGSPAYADRVATTDHSVVRRMKEAGALVIGKTNVPEFGLGSHSFNPVYGVTRNPYDLSRAAGGSSGGAAAALASRMLPVADGSDTGGSLRNPASFCNVVGFRPSIGRVPNLPDQVPFGQSSVKGPMGRDVQDTALLLAVLAYFEPRLPYSVEPDTAAYLAVARAAEDEDLFGEEIAARRGASAGGRSGERPLAAWTMDLSGTVPVDADVRAVVTRALAGLESSGTFDLVEAHPDYTEAVGVGRVLRALQLLTTLGPLVAERPELVKPDARENVAIGAALTAEQIAEAERGHARIFSRTVDFFDTHDVLLTPTCQVAPFDVHERYPRTVDGQEMGDYLEWMSMPYTFTVTGHPALTVPVGFTEAGLPVGLQVVGPYRREDLVLEYGRRIERAVGSGRIAPEIPTDAPVDRFPDIR
ncbi:amidase [Brevibacterium samyangense]|uniref:Amidase n=2 Tax=Brevibacterium samyangense TaxID=366888 RepID=A0ABN2T822_9MICO